MVPPLPDLLIDQTALAHNGGTLNITQLRGLFVLALAENARLRNETRDTLRWTLV
jgi:hypothetical protein